MFVKLVKKIIGKDSGEFLVLIDLLDSTDIIIKKI